MIQDPSNRGAVASAITDLHARFCGALTHRYFIRVHMSVMLGLVLVSGVVAGSAMRRAGLTHMGFRYPLAVIVSYAVFLGLVRLWVAYVCAVYGLGARPGSRSGSSGSSGGGLLDDVGSPGGGGSGSAAESFLGGGGSSGGGGASGSFGEAAGSSARPSSPMSFFSGRKSGSPGGGRGGSSEGGGGDGDGILLLILFALLVVAVFGAGAYVIYQAPAILSEAAFQAVLAGGIIRSARGAHQPGWMRSVLKATAIPFVLVLILSGVFGFEAHKLCPSAATARQVFRNCILK